jgi:hypothetical protein
MLRVVLKVISVHEKSRPGWRLIEGGSGWVRRSDAIGQGNEGGTDDQHRRQAFDGVSVHFMFHVKHGSYYS